MMENAWIVPLFPLLSFLVLLLFGKRLKESSSYIRDFPNLVIYHFFDTRSCLSDLLHQPIKVKHCGLQ